MGSVVLVSIECNLFHSRMALGDGFSRIQATRYSSVSSMSINPVTIGIHMTKAH